MSVHRTIRLFAPLLFICLCAGIALAQDASTISRSVIGGGGSTVDIKGNMTLSSVVGQSIAGLSSGGEVRMLAGFWSGGTPEQATVYRFAYLPTALLDYSSTWENCGDSQQDACQIEGCGTVLYAYSNDTNDWFYFDLGSTRNLTVTAANVLPSSQLLLYDSAGQIADHDGSNSSTKTVSKTLQRGYVRVYTASGHNTTTLYTLTLSCQ